MNYLKRFKIFESGIYNIVYDVKDICLDLDQEKLSIDIYKGKDCIYTRGHILLDKDEYETASNSKITISIEYMTEFGIFTKGISWLDIEEVIERLIDFFKINNYEIFNISIDSYSTLEHGIEATSILGKVETFSTFTIEFTPI